MHSIGAVPVLKRVIGQKESTILTAGRAARMVDGACTDELWAASDVMLGLVLNHDGQVQVCCNGLIIEFGWAEAQVADCFGDAII